MPPRHLPIVLALSLLGCPPARELIDAGDGEDAFHLDATDHHDTDRQDAGVDATDHQDAGFDAVVSDARVCACADDNVCTLDVCNAAGECVHSRACPAGSWCLANPDGSFACGTRACVVDAECPQGLACEEFIGCIRNACRYRSNADQDRDGALDRGCGGNDCQPVNRAVPGAESCNGIDDDCNSVVDDLASLSTDPRNCGVCGNACPETYLCVDGSCVCPAGSAFCRFVSPWCVDLRANPNNCGACGVTCVSGSACVDGLCT